MINSSNQTIGVRGMPRTERTFCNVGDNLQHSNASFKRYWDAVNTGRGVGGEYPCVLATRRNSSAPIVLCFEMFPQSI